jgi:putative endonuclease
MTDPRRALGAAGEAQAAAHLARRGYRILDRNVRAGGVEIDLVAVHRGTLVFVEVKTRRSRRQGDPALAVDARKQARLVRGALAWIGDHHPRTRRIRFDVIGCEPDASGWRITHWEGAFDASL